MNDNKISFNLKNKELWLLIGINGIVSIIISLLVVLVVGPWVFNGAVKDWPLGSNTETVMPTTQGTPLDELVSTLPTSNVSPTPTLIPEPILYVVETGDSLSGIAEKFNVNLNDLMAANGFDNPDFVQAGQTLIIPVGGLVEATPTFTAIPIPTETEIPTDPPSETTQNPPTPPSDISLTPTATLTLIPTATAPPLDEINVEISNVLGYGQLENEMVIIFNEGPGINLSGWKLTGSPHGDYSFPNLFLWNGGSVRIHTTTGANTPTDLYWGQDTPRWFSGDTITLKNANNEIKSTYIIP